MGRMVLPVAKAQIRSKLCQVGRGSVSTAGRLWQTWWLGAGPQVRTTLVLGGRRMVTMYSSAEAALLV